MRKQERLKKLKKEFREWTNNPRNAGKHYDKKLYQLLDKYDVTLDEYHNF